MKYYYETRDENGKKHHFASDVALAQFTGSGCFELEVSDEDVLKTALFFGYTPGQFHDQKARVQLGMIRDYNRQITEKAAADLSREQLVRHRQSQPARWPMCPEFGPDGMEGPTIRSVIISTAVLSIIVGIIIYVFH